MITHLRNRALKQLGIAFVFYLLTICLMLAGALGFPKILAAVPAILLGTFAIVFYIKGSIALAEAKGHSDSTVAAIIIAAALCTGFLFFVMPLIIFFGLEDKAKKRRRPHGEEPKTERLNPIAKLPPRREE